MHRLAYILLLVSFSLGGLLLLGFATVYILLLGKDGFAIYKSYVGLSYSGYLLLAAWLSWSFALGTAIVRRGIALRAIGAAALMCALLFCFFMAFRYTPTNAVQEYMFAGDTYLIPYSYSPYDYPKAHLGSRLELEFVYPSFEPLYGAEEYFPRGSVQLLLVKDGVIGADGYYRISTEHRSHVQQLAEVTVATDGGQSLYEYVLPGEDMAVNRYKHYYRKDGNGDVAMLAACNEYDSCKYEFVHDGVLYSLPYHSGLDPSVELEDAIISLVESFKVSRGDT